MSLYLAGCAVLFLGALYMILAPCYEDGIAGKLFLVLIGVGTFCAIANAWHGPTAAPPPELTMTIDGAALFLLRHLYRFRRYCSQKKDFI